MTVLIIHGIGGHAGIHWQQWLHDKLIENGYSVIMPNLPNPDKPSRKKWLRTIKDQTKGVNLQELIVVGHSLGVTTALDFLEEVEGKARGLISVSGFAEDYGANLNGYFLREKHIDFSKVSEHVANSSVIFGDNDPYVTREALLLVANELKVAPKIIQNGGHLNTDTGFTTFPYLLEIIKKLK
jgi:uncharacterized protein